MEVRPKTGRYRELNSTVSAFVFQIKKIAIGVVICSMEKGRIEVTFFFRKPRPHYHSIERVFGHIIEGIPDTIVPRIYTLKTGERGVISRVLALIEVWRNRGKINHITGDISYVALALPRKGLVVTFHDLDSLERKNKLVTKLLKWFWVKIPACKAQVITVISEHTRKKVLEWAKVPSDKIMVIPNPLPKGFEYNPKPALSDPPVVLAVGTKPNKNLEGIIAAVEGLGCQLLIVGRLSKAQDGMLKEKGIDYRNMVNATDQEIIDAYISCDVLCFPSFYEGFGMPIIEAQAIGRPVITSNYGAMKEVAGDGAVLVDPKNIDSIREGVRMIFEDSELRMSLINNGLKFAKTHYPYLICEMYTEIYSEVN
jgi:glycosyltransferase involved in cell wall biosynthesis